ncbi:2-octaprenyl-6-methoxyphenyl hydroxylase [Legionella quateirensis]|uniref:2-octaprenyl-6-methoxyphenol hydroxylase n=1 Tax=Legionella quateirensis TaxID=45072 RepID=A0A378KNW8_9GAMM|nr:2-octaprenyl-6-methoxyphenyl hydroxylase [Legionella quateirensis]KTD52968.1 2-octaprenyl-6-methoxyphenol hydroxylase [Legionella quateirensis]STY16302.1 2-octaprenyl-6-methoxyphenol hydroxylase [Legionella quateirensis]
MADKQTDILIVGGGLTGATLMLALRGLGYSTLLVESKPFSDKVNPDFDARSIALSPASKRILNMLGVWDILKEYATPITMIHVSDQYRFGVSRLQGEEHNPLGYVVEIQYINLALHQLLAKNQILAPATVHALDLANKTATVLTQSGEISIEAKLIVAADGADSIIRKLCTLTVQSKSYEQNAIVANIGLIKPHNFKAYERFTAHGPLALLPMQTNKMSLVWAMAPEKAKEFMELSDGSFIKELQQAFGYRLGRFVQVGKRFTYPLKQVLMPEQTKWPVVFVGNAAHTLHPVAGQGFNLGIRDVATLAQCIAKHGLNSDMLDEYLQLRHHDQQVITRCTDGLIQLFTSRLPGVGLARNIGLIALDNIPVLKNILARYARGFGGVIPDLVCEIALSEQELK